MEVLFVSSRKADIFLEYLRQKSYISEPPVLFDMNLKRVMLASLPE